MLDITFQFIKRALANSGDEPIPAANPFEKKTLMNNSRSNDDSQVSRYYFSQRQENQKLTSGCDSELKDFRWKWLQKYKAV